MLSAAFVVLLMVAVGVLDAPSLLRRGERRTLVVYAVAWLTATGLSAAYVAGVRFPNPTRWIMAGADALNRLLGPAALWR